MEAISAELSLSGRETSAEDETSIMNACISSVVPYNPPNPHRVPDSFLMSPSGKSIDVLFSMGRGIQSFGPGDRAEAEPDQGCLVGW